MFWHWLCLPINFYFPTIKNMKNTSMMTTTLLSYVNSCGKPLKRIKCSTHQRQRDRGGTTIGKVMPFHWNQVTWSQLKLTPTGWGGKWRTGGRRNHTKYIPGCWGPPFLPQREPVDRMFMSPPPKPTFSHHSYRGDSPLYIHVTLAGQVNHCHPRGTNPRREWDWGTSQRVNCSLLAQHQTGYTPLRWVGRKLCAFIQKFSRAFLLDQG